MSKQEQMYKEMLESLSEKCSRLEDQRDQLAEALKNLLDNGSFIHGHVQSDEAKENARRALNQLEESK